MQPLHTFFFAPCRRNLTLTARFAYYVNTHIVIVPLATFIAQTTNTTVAGCASPRLARVAGFVAAKQRKRSDDVAERYVISNCPDYTQNKGSHAKQEKRKSAPCRRGDRFAYIANACILLVPLSELTTQHLIYFENAACIYSQCLCFAFVPANFSV